MRVLSTHLSVSNTHTYLQAYPDNADNTNEHRGEWGNKHLRKKLNKTEKKKENNENFIY